MKLYTLLYRNAFGIMAWLVLLAICITTDGPIAVRPQTYVGANHERFVALGLLGFLFSLAYPRRPAVVVLFLLFFVCATEYAQTFIVGRHARFEDAALKCLGVVVGVGFGHLLSMFARRQ